MSLALWLTSTYLFWQTNHIDETPSCLWPEIMLIGDELMLFIDRYPTFTYVNCAKWKCSLCLRKFPVCVCIKIVHWFWVWGKIIMRICKIFHFSYNFFNNFDNQLLPFFCTFRLHSHISPNRATIVIKCDMDFVLYPLDVQSCPVDFSSCKFHHIAFRDYSVFIAFHDY